MNFDLVVRPAARQFHMLVTGGDIRMPQEHALPVFSLFHGDLTQFVQTLGE